MKKNISDIIPFCSKMDNCLSYDLKNITRYVVSGNGLDYVIFAQGDDIISGYGI